MRSTDNTDGARRLGFLRNRVTYATNRRPPTRLPASASMLLQREWTRPPFLLLSLWLLSALVASAVLEPSALPKLMRLARHLVQTRFASGAAQNDHKTSRPTGALPSALGPPMRLCCATIHSYFAVQKKKKNRAISVPTVIADQGLLLDVLKAEFLGFLCLSRLFFQSTERAQTDQQFSLGCPSCFPVQAAFELYVVLQPFFACC